MYLLRTQFKSNSALFFVALFRMLSCRGGVVKLSRVVYLAPHPLGYANLQGKGKLSRAVNFAPTHMVIKVK